MGEKALWVKATDLGYYGKTGEAGSLRFPESDGHPKADQFILESEDHFSFSWMEAIGWEPKRREGKPKSMSQVIQENIARLAVKPGKDAIVGPAKVETTDLGVPGAPKVAPVVEQGKPTGSQNVLK